MRAGAGNACARAIRACSDTWERTRAEAGDAIAALKAVVASSNARAVRRIVFIVISKVIADLQPSVDVD